MPLMTFDDPKIYLITYRNTYAYTHTHTQTHTHTHIHTYTYTPTHYKIKLVPAGQGLLRLKGHENIIKSGDHSKKCNKNANLLS